MKNYDLVYAIKQCIDRCNFEVEFLHVKGHQDDDVEYENLDRWAQLNVDADTLAKERMTEIINTTSPSLDYRLPFDRCIVKWTNKFHQTYRIGSNLLNTLKHHLGSKKIRKYWIRKKKFPEYCEREIDWELKERTAKGQSANMTRFIAKWCTGICGVGKMLVRYKHQTYDNCPLCNHEGEDTDHVLRCQHVGAKETWTKHITKLKTWMETNEGNLDLIQALIDNLNAWRNRTPFPDHAFDDNLVNQALLRQDEIGWRGALDGFLSNKWREAQHQYLHSIKSRRKSLYWMSRVQRLIWELVFAMWNHRNNHLHGDNDKLHQVELRALDQETQNEWNAGLNGLNRRDYGNLFKGSLQQRLDANINDKRMWLATVWMAREAHQEGTRRNINRASLDFCVRWGRRLRQETREAQRKAQAERAQQEEQGQPGGG